MTDLSTKSVCVYDYGAFVTLAEYLVGKFGRVFYFCPWQDAYPSSPPRIVGTGIPGVTRIERDIWDYLDEIDLFIFPEVCDGSLQEHLVSLGKRVWGSRSGEELELDRVGTKKLFKKLGMDVGPYKVVTRNHGLARAPEEDQGPVGQDQHDPRRHGDLARAELHRGRDQARRARAQDGRQRARSDVPRRGRDHARDRDRL
ncbi:hypothetical protein ACRAVF_27200 [Bradyrhizobium oligotrophicum S58]